MYSRNGRQRHFLRREMTLTAFCRRRQTEWCCLWYPTACGTLQECLGAAGPSLARVEKGPAKGVSLGSWGCQLRAWTTGPAIPDSAVRPACLLFFFNLRTQLSTIRTWLSAELCRSVCGLPQWSSGIEYTTLISPLWQQAAKIKENKKKHLAKRTCHQSEPQTFFNTEPVWNTRVHLRMNRAYV